MADESNTPNREQWASAIEDAEQVMLRWGHGQMRRVPDEIVEAIVAALKAPRSEPRTRGEGPNGAVCRKCHVLQLQSKKCAYCGADTQPLYFETNPCVVSLFPVNGSNERKER